MTRKQSNRPRQEQGGAILKENKRETTALLLVDRDIAACMACMAWQGARYMHADDGRRDGWNNLHRLRIPVQGQRHDVPLLLSFGGMHFSMRRRRSAQRARADKATGDRAGSMSSNYYLLSTSRTSGSADKDNTLYMEYRPCTVQYVPMACCPSAGRATWPRCQRELLDPLHPSSREQKCTPGRSHGRSTDICQVVRDSGPASRHA